MPWTSASSTISLASYPGVARFGCGALSAPFSIFQAFEEVGDPFDDPVARACAAYWACYGGVSFGYIWHGACPAAPPDGYEQDGNSWGTGGGLVTGINSQHTTALITVPSTYTVSVVQGDAVFSIDCLDPDLVGFFYQQAPGIIEIQVTAATLTVAFDPSPTAGAFAGNDWTAIIRKPTLWGQTPTWIDPGELASAPQVGTMAPGGGTTVSLSMVGGGRYFSTAVYLKSNLSEVGSQDLGVESSRYGQWLPRPVSLDLSWRYRTTDVVPGSLAIEDLGNEPRVYFEP